MEGTLREDEEMESTGVEEDSPSKRAFLYDDDVVVGQCTIGFSTIIQGPPTSNQPDEDNGNTI